MHYILILLISFTATSAVKWTDMDQNQSYSLKTSLKLENQSSTVELKKGARVKLIESIQLTMLKVQLKKFKLTNCEMENQETELQYIKTTNNVNSKSGQVGVNLSSGCVLEFFVKLDDREAPSFFE